MSKLESKSFKICAFPQYRDQTISQTEALDIAMNQWLDEMQYFSFEIVRTDIGSMPGRHNGQETMVVIVYFKNG